MSEQSLVRGDNHPQASSTPPLIGQPGETSQGEAPRDPSRDKWVEQIRALEHRNRILQRQLESAQAESRELEETNEKKESLLRKIIAELNQSGQQLKRLVAGTAPETGQAFFPALVNNLAETLGITYAVVTEREDDGLRVLAIWGDGSSVPPIKETSLETPCQRTLEQGQFYCAHSLPQTFPNYPLFREMGVESYLGIALKDSQGQSIGTLYILHKKPLADPQRVAQILQVFAVRATAELERQRASEALAELNHQLEARVARRTAEIQERKQFLQTVLDTVPQSVFWKDRDLVYRGANQVFLQRLGLSSEAELCGKTDEELAWGAGTAKKCQSSDRQVMESETAQLGFIEKVTQSDGRTIWFETNKLPLRNLKGEVIGILGTSKDITNRKQAEADRLRAEQLGQGLKILERIFDTVLAGYWDLDLVHNRGYLSPGFRQLLGYEDSDFPGGPKTWQQLIVPEDLKVVTQNFDQHVKSQGLLPFQFEARYRHRDGSLLWLLCAGQLIDWDEQGKPKRAVGCHIDIRDRKEYELRLQHTNQELERATRLKDEFLANMSHELRTPLNAVLGMTEGLQEGVFGEINFSQRRALQTIETSGSHLLSLINDVLDVAKIEAGQIELDLAPSALEPLCKSSLSFVRQQALEKRIQIQTQFPPKLPDFQLDERRIRQVLINLLSNAVKFTPEGGHITVAVDYSPDSSSQLRISVIDTGIGIAPEHLEQLFQPFFQIDSALNRQYTGTGLGLPIVKRIAELHGGRVEVTSKVGSGSCFTLDLPCKPVINTNPLAPPPSWSAGDTSQALPTVPHILLAEDNEANIRTLSSFLRAKGYRLTVARNGHEAVALAQAEQPDAILMDIQMPGMDGVEAIAEIRKRAEFHRVPIIALTALAMANDRDRCLNAGANEYLSKPVKLKQLVATLQQLVTDSESKE